MTKNEENEQIYDGNASWLNLDFLPDKPEGVSDYGYVDSGTAVACTWEELESTVMKQDRDIWYIWTPEHEKLVPVQENARIFSLKRPARLKLGYRMMTFGIIALAGMAIYLFLTDRASNLDSLNALILVSALGIAPLVQGIRHILRYRIPSEAVQKDEAMEARFNYWMELFGNTSVAHFLGIFLVIMFIFQYTAGINESLNIGATNAADVRAGEYFRLLSSNMLHVNTPHVLVNTMACIFLAKWLASIWSPAGTLLVYLLSGLGGSLLSVLITPQSHMAGASGAICGMLGFLFYVSIVNRRQLPGFVRWTINEVTVMLVVIGIIAHEFISNSGHAGGFFTGLILAVMLWNRRRIPGRTNQALWLSGAISGFIMVSGGIYLVFKIMA